MVDKKYTKSSVFVHTLNAEIENSKILTSSSSYMFMCAQLNRENTKNNS